MSRPGRRGEGQGGAGWEPVQEKGGESGGRVRVWIWKSDQHFQKWPKTKTKLSICSGAHFLGYDICNLPY